MIEFQKRFRANILLFFLIIKCREPVVTAATATRRFRFLFSRFFPFFPPLPTISSLVRGSDGPYTVIRRYRHYEITTMSDETREHESNTKESNSFGPKSIGNKRGGYRIRTAGAKCF